VEPGEDDFDDWRLLLGVRAHRNSTAVVIDADAAIGMNHYIDIATEARQRFVGSVVDHFLNDMERVVGPGIHAGSAADRLQPLQHPDGRFTVVGCARR
jgi:hypothetical protein